MKKLSADAMEQVAAYFRALAEPQRLRLLSELRQGERSVGQLVETLAATQSNVSNHLEVLFRAGLLARERRGTSTVYRIAEPQTVHLCDLVCGNVARIAVRRAGCASGLAEPQMDQIISPPRSRGRLSSRNSKKHSE